MSCELDEKEQAKIVRHFLLNSPPAQFSNVEKDLRGLVSSPGLLDRTLPLIAQRYNQDQMLVVTVPDSEHKTLITKFGVVGESSDQYYVPDTESVVTYDHIKKTAESKREATEDERTSPDVEEYRSQCGAALQEYVSNYYPTGVSVVYVKGGEGGQYEAIACISASKPNLANRWSGRMRCVYKCLFTPGSSSAEISGSMTTKVHYFEEGNVQLNAVSTPTLTCTPQDANEFGTSFVGAIEKFEQDYQTQLLENFNDLSDNTFKQLRRKLPLTGQKFDWDKWQSYGVGSEIGQ